MRVRARPWLLATLFGQFPFLAKLFADSAYAGSIFHTALPCKGAQRLGNGTNPLARSERLTISVLRLGRTLPKRSARR
jgi:hypothetical protein